MGRRKKNNVAEIAKERFSQIEKEKLVFSKKILTGKEINEKLAAGVLIIDVASKHIETVADYLIKNNNLIFISDGEGCLLQTMGNSKLLSKLKTNMIIAGTYPDESSILAKAIGGAVIGNKVTRIDGEFTEVDSNQWSAIGAPICSLEGETFGSIVILVPKAQACEHSAIMVSMISKLIDHAFWAMKKEENICNINDYYNAVFNQHPYSNITVDNEGVITSVSHQAAVFFGILESELIGSKISKILPRWDEIQKRVNDGIRVENVNVDLVNVPGISEYLLSVSPIILPDSSVHGAILAFRDLIKVNNVVNRFTGNWASYEFDDIIGVSVPFKKTVELAEKIASETSPVLIIGEVGIGKEVFAQAIHNASTRRENGFVKLALQSTPSNEIECELFGFEEGVFPGIKKVAQAGKFELAHGGTLYLDEISNLPLSLQDKLLAAIKNGYISRVGGNKQIKVDVRVMASTSKDIRELIQEGKFKLELFYLLTENPLTIPPLRERRHDVPLFIKYYLQEKAREQGKPEPVLPKKIVRILARYEWPQNVRELAKLMDYVVKVDGNIGNDVKNEREFKKKYLFIEHREAVDSIKAIEEIEHEAIINALKIMNGNMSKAARKLGVSRNTLYLKCKRYGIDI